MALIFRGGGFINPSGGSESTVLIDNSGGVTCTNGGNESGGTWLQPGSGTNGTANMVMLACLCTVNSASGVTSSPGFVWDTTSVGGSPQNGVLLSAASIVGSPSNSDAWFFYIINPNLGTTLRYTFSWTGGSSSGAVGGLTAVNADQTGGTTTFTNINSASGSSALASVSNTAPATRLTMTSFICTTNFSTGNGTLITGTFGSVSSFAEQYSTNLSPLTFSLSSGAWLANSISIKGA